MRKTHKILALILALITIAGVLAACVPQAPQEAETPPPEVSGLPENKVSYAVDKLFSLNCNRDYSFNPMTTPNANNVLCTQLMYDNIFNVDAAFELSSRIITDYSSADGVYWIFKVDTSVQFWDGTNLTAWDVAYSLQRAKQCARLKARLAHVWGITAQSDTQFAMTLTGPNTQIASLLTIPVIKDGSIEEKAPMGTGPYVPDENLTKLTLFDAYPDADKMPLDAVYLIDVRETDAAMTAFENAAIDLVTNDPTGLINLGYGSTNDTRYYPTTNMHYLGFNSKSLFFSNPLCRKAMTYIVNRDYIVNNIMGGAAVEAALPMNPASPLYNAGYSDMISYSLKKSMDALDLAQVMDYDEDGFREIMITGIPLETEITFIVCSDSAQKVLAAQSIANNLTDLGIKVTLKTLTWDYYTAALAAGEFDMYYAETMLTADFYPGALMLKDEPLNYGKFSDSLLGEKINDYMSADDAGRKKAADLMNKYITDTAPIITVCFERHQVITHRGVVAGMKPSQYNIFQNVRDWIVELG